MPAPREAGGVALVSADDGAASNQKRTPCRSKSVVARVPCLSRVRDGDGAGGKSAGGPMQEAPHPQERGCKARGTECGNLDRAAPSEIDRERVGGPCRDPFAGA